jgi:hypothetical protein
MEATVEQRELNAAGESRRGGPKGRPPSLEAPIRTVAAVGYGVGSVIELP